MAHPDGIHIQQLNGDPLLLMSAGFTKSCKIFCSVNAVTFPYQGRLIVQPIADIQKCKSQTNHRACNVEGT